MQESRDSDLERETSCTDEPESEAAAEALGTESPPTTIRRRKHVHPALPGRYRALKRRNVYLRIGLVGTLMIAALLAGALIYSNVSSQSSELQLRQQLQRVRMELEEARRAARDMLTPDPSGEMKGVLRPLEMGRVIQLDLKNLRDIRFSAAGDGFDTVYEFTLVLENREALPVDPCIEITLYDAQMGEMAMVSLTNGSGLENNLSPYERRAELGRFPFEASDPKPQFFRVQSTQ